MSHAAVTLHELFLEQAARTPGAVAVEDAHDALTYAELADRSARLARRLRGAGPLVGVAADRTVETAVAVLGVLRSGAAYLPLDPAYPAARLGDMLMRAQVAVTVAPPGLRPPLPSESRIVASDAADPGGAELPEVRATDPAYVIFTSGSTGVPKGVSMPHRGPVNLVRWQRGHSAPAGRTLHFASLSFDVACQEMFDTWAGGGTLVMIDEPTRRDPERLGQSLEKLRIERLFLPYVALNALAVALAGRPVPQRLREIVTAGEQLLVTPGIRGLFQRLGACTLENQYGPTETHVVSSHQLGPDPAVWPDLPPIGTAIEGLTMHVLDGEGQPVPDGESGELSVAGVGLADGYLHRPDLTAERFVTGPDGRVCYRTGDIVTSRDGLLHFLGRADDQVKIRGHRVELGEVEAGLARHPDVAAAAVAVWRDPVGMARLRAYVVLRDEAVKAPGPNALRAYVAGHLPAHLVPDVVSVLDELPRTSSGKVDRRALPLPAGDTEGHSPAGATVEAVVLSLVRGLFGRQQIGLQDRLHEVGADSLTLLALRNRIRDSLQIDLALASVFASSTVGGLVRTVEAAEPLVTIATALSDEAAPDSEAPSPASSQQRQFWFLQRASRGSAYNDGLVLRVDGPLDVQQLSAAVREVATRHPVLRSRLQIRQRDLYVVPGRASDVRVDVCDVDADADGVAVQTELNRPFDLGAEPPWRAAVLRHASDTWTVVLTLHHAAADGSSVQQIVDDLTAAYERTGSPGDAGLLPAPESYAMHAVRQRARPADRDGLRWWVDRLSGVDPDLALPGARNRGPSPGSRGGRVRRTIGPGVTDAVRDLARLERATPNMVLLAVFAGHLARCTGRRDLVIGVPAANRPDAADQDVVGPYVNTLPLRLEVLPTSTTVDLVRRTRDLALAAYEHESVPFADIVAALGIPLGVHPLVQVLFTAAHRLRLPSRMGQLPVRWDADPNHGRAVLDLNATVHDCGTELTVVLTYDRDRYDEGLAAGLLDGWLGSLPETGAGPRC